MHCPNCHQTVEPGAQFCTHCGTPIQQNVSEAAAAEAGSKAASSQGTQANQVKNLLSGYWSYFLRTLKHPISQGLKEEEKYDGYISFFLTALLFSIGLSTWFGHWITVAERIIPPFFGTDFTGALSRFLPDFYQIFLFVLIDMLAIAVVTFAVLKLVYRQSLSFHVFVTRYAAQGTPTLVLSALAFLTGLIGMQGTLATLIFTLTFALMFLPSITSLILFKNHGTVDNLYGYFIALAASLFIQYLLFKLALRPVVTGFQDILLNGLGGF